MASRNANELRSAIEAIRLAAHDPDAETDKTVTAIGTVRRIADTTDVPLSRWSADFLRSIEGEPTPDGVRQAVLVLEGHFKMPPISRVPAIGEQGQLF